MSVDLTGIKSWDVVLLKPTGALGSPIPPAGGRGWEEVHSAKGGTRSSLYVLHPFELASRFQSFVLFWPSPPPAVLRAHSRFCAQGSLLAELREADEVLGIKPSWLEPF